MKEADQKSKELKQTETDTKQISREPWTEPKLTFVEPKLTRHGELTQVTGQFFGAFSPEPIDD